MKRRIAVIGAGVIGCSLADELTRKGAAVTLIDAAEIRSGTSASTFAWVNANNKTPIEYSALNFLGLRAYERSADRGGSRWFHQCGHLQIAQTGEEMAFLEDKVQRLSAQSYEATLLAPAKVYEVEPALKQGAVLGGAWFAREGWVDTETMCSSLVNRALAGGAIFAAYETVTDINAGRVLTRDADGRVRRHAADTVILAAGNGTRNLLCQMGIDFPLTVPGDGSNGGGKQIGVICTTKPIESGIRHIVHSEKIAVRPSRNGGITLAGHPTDGEWAIDDPKIWSAPALLLSRAQELFPSLRNANVESMTLGERVLPKDGVTIADWVNGSQSIYAIATHSGVTLSAHLAEAVATEVLTGARHSSLGPFGLARFATAADSETETSRSLPPASR